MSCRKCDKAHGECTLHRVERLKRERDAARAEVERLREERDRVARELRRLDEHGNLRAAIRAVAERQREACATEAAGVACYGSTDEVEVRESCVASVRATPLVTEVEP